MSRNTADGNLITAPLGISAFTTSATAPSTTAVAGVTVGQVCALSSGGSTGAIYHWNGTAWVDTGATVAHFYGKST